MALPGGGIAATQTAETMHTLAPKDDSESAAPSADNALIVPDQSLYGTGLPSR